MVAGLIEKERFYEATGERPDENRKFFIPLENNPAVFTPLTARLLDRNTGFAFHDIYSLDPDALTHIPRPAAALIVLIPSEVYWRRRARELSLTPYRGSGPDEPVVYFKQTIGDACGLIALLHALANTSAAQLAASTSLLTTLLAQTLHADPAARAKVLYDSAPLEEAHMSVATGGDTVAPALREPNYHHFICFTKGRDGRLYELEGGWVGPLDRGELGGEDVLSERGVELSMRPYLDVAEGEVGFSMIAMTLDE